MRNIKTLFVGLFLLLGAFVRPALALEVTTIMSNGPTNEKLDLVFLGDGYTAAQMGLYASDVKKFSDYLFSTDGPFKDYKNKFNVYRVDVISNQSGVDNTCTGVFVDNALDSAYHSTGIDCRLLYTYSSQKVFQAAAFAPAADATIIITNSELYGGAASYGGYGVFYHGSDGPEVLAHELGHSLGFLADEYFTFGTTYSGGEPFQRNVSINTNRSTLKWNRWVYPTTPIPTVSPVNDLAGLFQGGNYSQFGIYRATNASKMQFLYRPYERVNYDALLDEIYRYLPADTTPATAELSPDLCGDFTNILPVNWTLKAADPESHVFAYRFSTKADFSDTALEMASNQPTFEKQLTVAFSPGDGVKTVYYDVLNGYKLVTSASCAVTLDTEVPTNPGQPQASNQTGGTFTLNWTASTDSLSGVSHYEIYRSTDGGATFSLLNLSNDPTFQETDLPNGTYVYKVRAKDMAGNTSGYSPNSDPVVVTSGTFTLVADPDVIKPGGTIKVSWSAPAGSSKTDWIGFFKVGAPDSNPINTITTKGKPKGTLNVTAPKEPGMYEFRYFVKEPFKRTAVSNPVKVRDVKKYTLTPNKTVVVAGANVTVSWSSGAGNLAKDWIGLYAKGTSDKKPVSWAYTNGHDEGKLTFKAPQKAGTYEFRYFKNNTYEQVAVSVPLTVYRPK